VTSVAAPSTRAGGKIVNGLRVNSFAAIVMLLIEFGLGVGVNLYVTLPSTGSGGSLSSAFRESVSGGPAILAVHAVLGTLLLLTGTSALVRAIVFRRRWTVVVTTVALVSIVVAWISGSKFVADGKSASSLSMALATAITILSYALILFVLPKSEVIRQQDANVNVGA